MEEAPRSHGREDDGVKTISENGKPSGLTKKMTSLEGRRGKSGIGSD